MVRALGRFKYLAPENLGEATFLLEKYGKKSAILAGGTDLLVDIGRGIKRPEYVINIKRIPDIDYIKYDEIGGFRIGALANIRAIERSVLVQERNPLLFEAVHDFGTVQVKNRATIGGNICRNSVCRHCNLPRASLCKNCQGTMIPPLLVLDAELQVIGPNGERTIPLEKFFVGRFKTAIGFDEVLTEVKIPSLNPHTGTAFLTLRRTSADFPKLVVAVAIACTKGICKDVRIALSSVAPIPLRAKKAEEVLEGECPEDEKIEKAAKVAMDVTKPETDIRSTAEYRKEVGKILVRRALKTALKNGRG